MKKKYTQGHTVMHALRAVRTRYMKLICFACIAAFVSGCSINESKTTSNSSNAKNNKQIVPSGHLEGSTDEDEITSEASGVHQDEITSEAPGSNDSQTEENSGQNTITTQEKPTAQPEEKEIKSATGYVLKKIGNIVYVDLENAGERKYPGEGEDRGVAFDITNATITQEPLVPGDQPSNYPIRKSVTVDILYYVEGDANIVTTIHSDNYEKETMTYISTGTVVNVEENKVTLDITEGDQSGMTAVFNISKSLRLCDLNVNEKISIMYYITETENLAISYYEPNV